jgi:two-component system, NarL family, nitrate/nitrite sensor histidine kinase NarX
MLEEGFPVRPGRANLAQGAIVTPHPARGGLVAPDILSEIASSLSNEHDLEALLQRFLGTIVQLAGASAGAARVLTDDGTRLRLVGAVGLPEEVLEREASVEGDCGICGDAARENRVEETADVRACAARTSCDYFGGQCTRVLAVPLRHRGRMLGVYNLFLGAEQRIGSETLSLLRSIGELLGLALENARLARESMRATLMNERQMMANEVHDALAQTLSYMKMRMALLEQGLRDGDASRSLKYAGDVDQALSSAYSSLRELLTHFRKRMDPQGLLHALKETAEHYYDRTGVLLDFDNRAPDLQLPVEQELQVFHIVQEALANVSKHAGARHARLVLDRHDGEFEITIEDDGAGIRRDRSSLDRQRPRRATTAHLGLDIMRERARTLRGEIEIASEVGRGTRVRLKFPAAAALKGTVA